MGEALECFVGQQVKIVFDDGGEIRAKHGTLISAADGFTMLETPHGICAIRIAKIIKVQQEGGRVP
jgi:hypothetical protein